MGYYIEVPQNKGKAQQLVELHGARILDKKPSFNEVAADKAIICVMDNGPWEAAAYAYNERELERFAEPDSVGPQRPRVWLIMDRTLTHKLTGYMKEF
jgi:hypothetical protein